MIDITKTYTCNGKRVINLSINENPVTYPVRGTVVLREKPWKTTYAIWSIDGINDVVWGKGHNLVEVQS